MTMMCAQQRSGTPCLGRGGRLAVALTAASLVLVAPAAVQARDLPDLVITGIDLKASGDCSGRTPLIIGKAQVSNIGQGRGEIFTTREMIASSIAGRPEIHGADRFVNSMRPGEMVTVEVRLGAGRAHRISGTHVVVVTLDPKNVFKEENEANNRTEVSVALACE